MWHAEEAVHVRSSTAIKHVDDFGYGLSKDLLKTWVWSKEILAHSISHAVPRLDEMIMRLLKI